MSNDLLFESDNQEIDVLSTKPVVMVTEVQYNKEHPCHKLYMNNLTRRRLDECFVSLFFT